MKKATFILGIALTLSGTSCSNSKKATSQIGSSKLSSNVSEYLDNYFSALTSQEKFQGVVLVKKGNEIIFHKPYGVTDLRYDVPNQIEYSFRIGSITKSFTSTLIAMEVEKGNLSWETKVDRFIPDFERGSEITIQHLLSHTSGIKDYFMPLEEELYIQHTPEELINYFKNEPLNFEPGENWEYSNSNYALLGYFLEQINSKSYSQILKERIIQPLKLNETGYLEEEIHLAANGHGVKPNGEIGYINPVHPSVSYAAGAMLSSTSDLVKFSEALKNGKLVSLETLEKMTTPIKNAYGLGFIIHNNFDNNYYGHNGGNDGFHANWKYYPELDLTTVILCNNFTAPFGKIVGTTAKIIFDQPFEIPVAHEPIELAKEVMQKYLGKYRVNDDMYIEIIFEDDQLAFQGKGQDAYKVLPYDSNAFFLKASDVTLVFQVNEEGEAIALEWDQGSGKEVFQKIQ